MSNGALEFGDIFQFEQDYYIFLVGSSEIYYCAKILNEKISEDLERRCNISVKNNKKIDIPLFCYVILTTDDFKNRTAHFGIPEFNYNNFNKLSITLNDKDLVKIKNEILESRALPIGLKELVSKIILTSSSTSTK